MTRAADRPRADASGRATSDEGRGNRPDDVGGGAAGPDDSTGARIDATVALAPLRERIDAIDREIVALLNERAEIALEIGRVKDATGGRAIRDPKREAEVIERVTSASAGLFPEPELVALYRRLIAATRQVQVEQRRRARLTEREPEG